MSAGSASTKTKFVALFMIATLVVGSLAVALPLNSPENSDTEPELKMYSDAVGATELVKKNGAYIVSNGQIVYLQLINLSDSGIMTSGTTQNGETEVLVHYSNNGVNSDIIFTQVLVQNGDSEIFPWTVGDFTADGIFNSNDPNDEAILCDTTGIVMYGKIRSTGLRDLLTAANSAPDFIGYCGVQDSGNTSSSSSGSTSDSSNSNITSNAFYDPDNANSYCTDDTLRGNLKIDDEHTYVKIEACKINGNIKIKNSHVGLIDSTSNGNIKSKDSDLVIDGGQVRGRIEVKGGSLYVEGADIRGSVEIEHGAIYLGDGTVIHGNLKCKNVDEYEIYDTVVKGKVKGCELNGSSNGNSPPVGGNGDGTGSDATVWTDKADYHPEEIVTIFGSGFNAVADVTITVKRPNGVVDTISTTTDNLGNFVAHYQLDGIEGLYLVTATDGTNIATTTFTDDTGMAGSITASFSGTQLTVSGTYTTDPSFCNDPDKIVGFAIFINGGNPDNATPGSDTQVHLTPVNPACATSGTWGPHMHTLTSPPTEVCVVIYDVHTDEINNLNGHNTIAAGANHNDDNSYDKKLGDKPANSYADESCTTDIGGQGADLSVTKSDSPDPVIVGNTLTYTLTVTNSGTVTASNVKVTDTLPSGVSFVSASGSGWSCSESGGVVECTRSSLPVGTAPPITITVTPTTSGTKVNTVTVTSDTNDPDPSDNTDTETTTVNTPPTVQADLSIIKSDSPDPVTVGSQLTYSITVKNNGPNTANNVVITDTLPSDVTFFSASTGCTNVGNTVTCNIGTLAVNQSVTKQIVVSVSQSASGTITNTAKVESSTDDPNLGNNTAVQTTGIKGPQLIPLTVIKLLKQPNGILTELQNAQVIVQDKTGNQVATGNTGVDGSVTFNLPAGVYTVKIVPPPAADGCRFVPDIDTVEVILLSAKIVKVVNTLACPQPGAAKIIVQKFLDKDGDGIGDEVLSGVKIVLLNSFGNEVDRGVTDANGIIMFDPIATQNTQFSIIEPAQVLPGNCVVVSSNPALPITVIVSAGQTHPIVKISNVIECQKIPLNVIKWLDVNKNGVQDEGESGLPNFTIQVFDQTGFNLIAQEVTDVNGDAMFNLVPGTYIVREKFPSAPDNCAWFQTFPGPDANLQHKITLSTADPTIKFGNFLKCPEPTGIGRIQVIKFQDDNRNKVQDNGEARLAGFEIKVFDSTGITLIASGLTDSNGHVQFDVPNGVYVVREVTREVPESCISGNWEQTTPGAPTFAHKVSVLIGSDQTVQFGNVLVCPDVGKIVVTKFNDKDGDGVRDMVPFVEPVVKGFRIKVYHPDDLTTPLLQTLTDSQGMATFILPPGNYIIREDVFGPVPSDCRGGTWTQTFPGAGTVVQPTNYQHMVTVGVQQVVTMSDIGQPLLFGNKLTCFEAPVKLVVHKFFDTNRDGVENNSESALKGFTIWVYTNQMQLVAKGTTDTTGSVTFNLPAGSYKVFEEFRVLMPSECLGGRWIQTSPGFDIQDSPLVDIDELAFNSITITLLPGEMKHIKFGDVLDCPPQPDP